MLCSAELCCCNSTSGKSVTLECMHKMTFRSVPSGLGETELSPNQHSPGCCKAGQCDVFQTEKHKWKFPGMSPSTHELGNMVGTLKFLMVELVLSKIN